MQCVNAARKWQINESTEADICTVDICTTVASCNDIAFQIWSTVAGYMKNN